MAVPAHSDLEAQVWLWIRRNKRESSRLEFKLRIDLASPGARAEFVRDVIALANSEGEFPRREGHLVIGFGEGRRQDIRGEHYDGARFGQILDSYIFPPVNAVYEEYGDDARGRVGVLIIRPDDGALYVVSKRLPDGAGRSLLLPGQCWGRKSDRKVELDGEAIHRRLKGILERKIAEATAPLRERIGRLEREGGPAFEVRRIRFAMEATRDWADLEARLGTLVPYATEFNHVVKNEVLDAVAVVTGRARFGMPLSVARSVDCVLAGLMPVGFGGMLYPARREIRGEDLVLLERIEQLAFELAWDACRYLRDLAIVEVGAGLYWSLIRFATLNRLKHFQSECLENARRCAQVCMEERGGERFVAGRDVLENEIRDALDVFDGGAGAGELAGIPPGRRSGGVGDGEDNGDYVVKRLSVEELTAAVLSDCASVIKRGGAVDWRAARRELPAAAAIAVARCGSQIVGVGAVKRERRRYAARIAKQCGVDFPPETLELGYVAVDAEHRRRGLSSRIVAELLSQNHARLFATTDNEHMKRALSNAGFVREGKEWPGRRAKLSFWCRGCRG